jgi:aminoglycoside 3-N-acetyltransferase
MDSETITQSQISAGLRDLGLGHGASVLVHSSLSSFGYVNGGAATVIDALLQTVEPHGTVVVPTLTGSEQLNAENPPVFDPLATPCWTGRIPETLRQRPDALRSRHPTHSVAAIGSRAAELIENHEHSITPCGPDSPYGKLASWSGQILLLGVSHEVSTMFHHVEELVGVPYHMQPGLVAARLILEHQERIVHIMLHRYGPRRQFARMEPVFRERSIQQEGQIGNAHVRLVNAQPMVEITRQALLQDPHILLARNDA